MKFARLGSQHRCARCKADLAAPAAPVDVPDAPTFDALVREAALPVVVDYWAPWCGPCRTVAPELEKVARANVGRFIVAKVNTEEVPELGDRYGIRSIPTMAVFAGGREVGRTSGARPAPDIEAFVRESLGAA
jgi:thioredoxin 2